MRAAVLSLLVLLACQAPVTYPRAVDARASTFRVEGNHSVDGSRLSLGTDSYTSYGTAWVVFNEPDKSYLITAGHVCKMALWEVPEELGGGYFPQKSEYVLRSYASEEFTARVLARSSDSDLCLLVTNHRIGPALHLATDYPAYDEPVMYVGAPSTIYGNGAAPVYRGVYAGSNVLAMPTAGGASGSAIMTRSGVVGVLTAVNRSFPNLTYMVLVDELRDFLRENRLPL